MTLKAIHPWDTACLMNIDEVTKVPKVTHIIFIYGKQR